MKNKSKAKWIKFRHRIITAVAYAVIAPYARLKYNVKISPFKKDNRQYLILLNHQTAFDQFFVGIAFRRALYYLASEDLFSNGFVSKLLRYAVAPIPIKKQTTDIKAVKTCIRVAKEGGSIVVAPEGNRTYDGKPVHMNTSIASLAKMLKLPIALFKNEGGYGVQPRWSDVIRKGKMKAYVSKVLEPEEYLSLSDEELFLIIKDGLYINEATNTGEFVHKKNAEFLERVMYVCPNCGLSTFESHNDIITCKKCNIKVRHLPTKQLKGESFDFPFEYVGEWYDYQCNFIRNIDLSKYTETPIYTETASLSEVIVYKNKKKISDNAKISLFGDKITIETANLLSFHFDEISAFTVLGKNKLNIYTADKLYQIKGDKRFNAIKYVNILYSYKSITKDGSNGKFLGL